MDSAGLWTDGNRLPVMEEFYSLQGEGYHSGEAAYFLRIGGCDVGCSWCDTKESWNRALVQAVKVDEIIGRIRGLPARSVVVTGGEPLTCNLSVLCAELQKHGYRTFLETSGTCPLTGAWDWICLSPKRQTPPLPGIFPLAGELKIIVEDEKDLEWAEQNAARVSPECKLYLQPEWSRRTQIMPVIVGYIKAHPEWKVSLQSHKYMGIP